MPSSTSTSSSTISQEFEKTASSQEFRKSPPSHPIAPPTKSSFLKRRRTTNKNLSVQFDSVSIKEFPMILGDNPSPNDGVPITIGWKAQRKGCFQVDYFEQHHKPRRYGNYLKLTATARAKLAVLGGATFSEIGATAYEVAQIQKKRAQSSQKGAFELLKQGFKSHQKKTAFPTFSRVPNEAPRILSDWKANAERLETFCNNNNNGGGALAAY